MFFSWLDDWMCFIRFPEATSTTSPLSVPGSTPRIAPNLDQRRRLFAALCRGSRVTFLRDLLCSKVRENTTCHCLWVVSNMFLCASSLFGEMILFYNIINYRCKWWNPKLQYELDANDEIKINCFCLLANVVATPVRGQDFPTDVALAWTPGDGFTEPVVCAFGDWGGTSYTHKLHSYAEHYPSTLRFSVFHLST